MNSADRLLQAMQNINEQMRVMGPLVEYLLPLSYGYDCWRLPLEGRSVTLKVEDWPEQSDHGGIYGGIEMCCGFKINWDYELNLEMENYKGVLSGKGDKVILRM